MGIEYNDIFNFPSRTLLKKRLTKVFFSKNFELSSIEKKTLQNEVVKMEWVSSLKPSNTNIPKFETENHVVEEVQFMTCTVSNLDKHGKVVVDLFQKYIPYQIVLVLEDEGYWMLNLTNKRINLNDRSKRTIEKSFSTNPINKTKSDTVKKFIKTLSFDRVNRSTLNSVYQSYINSVIQFKSAVITGVFNEKNLENNQRDIESIERKENLEMEIITLKNQLKRETQLNSQVSINMEIQKRKQEIQNIKQTLSQ
jgi:hypothetical protein